MPGLKHATKKRLAKTTTRRRTIHSGISAEHIEYRDKLTNVSTSIKSLIREIGSARQVWLDLARHQNGFAEALVKALPADGVVRSHAKEVENTVQQLQTMILDDDSPSTPHRKIVGVLEAYLKLVQMVEKHYPALETAYTEVLRYQRKVDKLSRKKKEDALHRNMTKLQDARTTFDSLLKDVITKQKEAFEKHEAVFQCAHHAFWIAHDKYAHVVNEATKSIRMESVAVREHLVNIDVSNTPKLTALPRVKLLPPPQPDITPAPTIEIPSDASSGKVVPPPMTSPPHVVHTIPNTPTQVVQTFPNAHTQIVQSVSNGVPQVHAIPPQMSNIPSQDYPSPVVHFHSGVEAQHPGGVPTAPPVEPYMQTHHEYPERIYSVPSTQVVHTQVPSTKYYTQEPSMQIPQVPTVPVPPPHPIAPTLPTEIPPPPSVIPQSHTTVPV